ncbi:MAG: site-specific integrase, partial [Nitrospirae bacterium]|nr:site-specific integrase [Nitrospirota bacterium]
AFNLRQYPLFAQHLGPLPPDSDGSEGARPDLRSCRNRLWAELCLHTGMRPEEPARISKYAILDLTPDDPDNSMGKTYLKITGKRNVTRKVELPNFLLNWLVWYIENERQEAVKEGLKRGSIKKNEPVNLFLNGPSARHNAGRAMSYKTFYDEFHRAALAAGLTETIAKADPETGEQYFTKEPIFSPHCLRHTFAVWMYFFERKNGNTEPWKRIQALLGHRHLSTTMNIYLRISGELEAIMSDRVVGHFSSGLYGKI